MFLQRNWERKPIAYAGGFVSSWDRDYINNLGVGCPIHGQRAGGPEEGPGGVR